MNNDFQSIFGNGADLRWRFTSYIEHVIKNAKNDYIRKLSYRKREILVEEISDSTSIAYEEQERIQLDNGNGFSFEEERLASAFSQLPLLRQKILTLVFVEELSANEVAQKLNCSVNYVYKQKHLALKKLRDILLSGGNQNDK